MKPLAVFLDTSALLALINSDDALHRDALAVQDDLNSSGVKLVTTEWVLAELLNHTAPRNRRATGIAAVLSLLNSPRTTIQPATSKDWHDAFALYCRRADKGWSLVDCSSILTCKALGIRRVFTHDHHFRQAGFQILL